MTGVIFASVICFLRLQEGVSIRKIIEIRVKIGLISIKFKVYIYYSSISLHSEQKNFVPLQDKVCGSDRK